MQQLVRSLVRSELPSESDERLEELFLIVFRQLSCALRPQGAAEQAVVEELIVQHLQGLRRSDRGLDRHLRFQGLKNRLRHWLCAGRARCGIFSLLFLLRGDTFSGERTLLSQPIFRAGREAQSLQSLQSARSSQRSQSSEGQVGWQLGLGAPRQLPEAKLVRDLLFALQGVASDCFKLDSSFDVDPAVVLSRPAWAVSQRVLELATLHARLTRPGASKDGEEGLLQQALGEALRQQLQDYYEGLALLMSKPPSLRSLWARLLGPRARLGFLAALSEASRGIPGGALTSTVFAFAQTGDEMVQEIATAILSSVVKPLMTMIRVWMTEGELQDPFGEFFVATASVPLEELWTRMYFLELEMVPSFITLELARKILLTGKSVNFIRLCCPKHRGARGFPELPELDLEDLEALRTPGTPGPARSTRSASGLVSPALGLAERVEVAAQQTNEHLVKLLMEDYALRDHALALRRFLLLGQGDFVESLLDAAQEELNAEASSIQRHQLMGLLDMALRQSNAQFFSSEVLARLGVKLLSPSPGECGWDIFLLDYQVDAPINVVFTPAAMRKYDRAFAFLWKLRRASHALAASWNQHMALQRHLVSLAQFKPEMRQTLHRCTCLRNEMHHFVQNIQSYVFEVLDTSWAKLQAGWRACADLDEVISLHEGYLRSIEEGAFLAPGCEVVLDGITELLSFVVGGGEGGEGGEANTDVAGIPAFREKAAQGRARGFGDFCNLQNQACAASLEAAEAMMEAEAEAEAEVVSVFQALRSQPFARSLAECRAQLDCLASAFATKLQQLLTKLQQELPELSFLCCRLDFNGYYDTSLEA